MAGVFSFKGDRMIQIRLINADPSLDLYEAALTCRGKTYNGEQLTYDKMVKWLIAEHSPVEALHFQILLTEQKKPVVSQLVRHTAYHPRHWVHSSRPDLTGGKPRDPNALIRYDCQYDPLALIEMMRKRLCFQAEIETLKQSERIKVAFMESGNDIIRAMGFVMVPHCVYRGGCPELFTDCGRWKKLDFSLDLIERYRIFNKQFLEDFR